MTGIAIFPKADIVILLPTGIFSQPRKKHCLRLMCGASKFKLNLEAVIFLV
jgi:hypothetical protein